MRALDREIFRLAIPSILANITVPLVGMTDLVIAGHLHGGAGSAAFIGAVSVGALLFSVLYWNFAFLRAGTGGLTAQAFGRAQKGAPIDETARLLGRGLVLAISISLILIALQLPFAKLGLLVIGGTPEVTGLASRYFLIRIWASPATLSLMVFRGWFIGMQDTRSSMWVDLVVNFTNILASLLLAFPLGLGFDGIAWGTVTAQYCGLAFSVLVLLRRYREVLRGLALKDCLHGTREFFTMNGDLFLRSLSFMGIYLGFSAIAARYGDTALAAASLMMNLLMLFSYFTDGFAYAGEALAGRYTGEEDGGMVALTVRRVFLWSMAVALAWVAVYAFAGKPLVALMTDDAGVRLAVQPYLWWLALMPPLGCAAFTWDGIYTGATATAAMRNSMFAAAAAFFAVWFAGRAALGLSGEECAGAALHLLLAAYFVHLAVRTVWLTVRRRRDILR
mgnify:FL=1